GRVGAHDGVTGAWLQRRAIQCAPLVIERDGPECVEKRRCVTAAARDELVHAIAIRARRQGTARLLEAGPPVARPRRHIDREAGPHVERHRGQIERRADQRVIEIEDAETHGSRRIPCYDNRVIMKRRGFTALALLLFALLPTSAARAVEEADRLFLVGERASADGIAPVARRVLERFVNEFPKDSRLPAGVLLLALARLPAGDNQAALEACSTPQHIQ